MLEINKITYLAIITISAPGLERPIQVVVKLLPPDYVEVVSPHAEREEIEMIPLRDCTLGDLQAYAQRLEADLIRDLEEIRLSEFAIDPDSELIIQILDDKRDPLPAKESIWSRGMLVAPPVRSVEAVPVADESLGANEDMADWSNEAFEIRIIDPDDVSEDMDTADDLDGPHLFLPEAPRGSLVSKVGMVTRALAQNLLPDDEPETEDGDWVDNLYEDRGEILDDLLEPAREEIPIEEITALDEINEIEDDDVFRPELTELDEETADFVDDVEAQPEAEPIFDDSQINILLEDTEPVHEIRKVDGPDDLIFIEDEDKLHDRMAGEILPLDTPTNAAVDILMAESAFSDAKVHALSSMYREVAGVLVGPHPQKQPNGRYVVQVTDAIEAKHTRMHGASVTYTPESWRYVNDKLMEMYPNEECVIVGWYHTHPGFGIFLSNMDLFIHHNFFTQKWHIALVLDPHAKVSGFFTWDRNQTQMLANRFAWPYWAHSSW